MRLVVEAGGIDLEITERGGPYPWLTKVGDLFSAARAPHLEGLGAGESANMQVELDNTEKQASELLDYALRAPAKIYDDAGDLFFSGLIQQIEFGLPLALTLEAGGGNLLDSDPLPLRSTRALGDYADDTGLPHILGDWSNTQFPLIRLSDTRFFVADHPMTVSKAFTGGQQSFGWAAKLESDDRYTWTVVEFDAPVPKDMEATACGKGKLDDDTGELIENGGDGMRYFAKLAGRADDFSEVRAECSAKDIRVAVRIAERKTYGQVLDSIAESFGAIRWHGGARLYPTTADPEPILDLDKSEVDNLRAVASLSDTADILRLSYDQSPASGRALHYVELTASPQRYGGLSKEIVYPHLRTPANAEKVGRPVLQRLAGKKYDVSFDTSNDQIRPGMWVRPVSHPDWTVSDDDPIVMVQRINLNQDTKSTAVKGEAIVGQSVVTVTAHSLALPDTVQETAEVSIEDGIATFTIQDKDKHPIKGARVSLDGSAAKTTDAQGKVQFPSTPGFHDLSVLLANGVTFGAIVELR